jgi:DNA-binding response OmpR family regulator
MPLSGHRILLVEDEAIIALDLKVIIGEANGEVAAYAPNLAKALLLTDTPGLSLAVLDFRLGSENSLPVARKLYAAGVPFVFYTGNAGNISEIFAGVPILPKPVDPARLISTLASLTVKRPRYAAA